MVEKHQLSMCCYLVEVGCVDLPESPLHDIHPYSSAVWWLGFLPAYGFFQWDWWHSWELNTYTHHNEGNKYIITFFCCFRDISSSLFTPTCIDLLKMTVSQCIMRGCTECNCLTSMCLNEALSYFVKSSLRQIFTLYCITHMSLTSVSVKCWSLDSFKS